MSATLTAGIASLVLNIDQPMEADLVTPRDDLIGVKVWVDSSSAAFTPSETNLVFDGNSLSVTIPNLSFGVTYYVKYALISDIEPENYVVSSALSATPLESTYEQDTTPAPTPTGVVFTAGFSSIFVSHDLPNYTQGHGHSRSVLFGKDYTNGGTLPTFEQSVSLGEFAGTSFTFTTNPSRTWRLWLVWVTNDGVASTVPFGGTNGVSVTTAQDPSDLLSAIAGDITETQLSSSLNTRINLIDADASVAGSVNQRVQSEASIRADQIQIESHERLISVQEAAYAALQATVAANNERTDRVADVALARTELAENLQDGLLAEASQRTILAAQLRGGYTGTDLNQVTSGLIYEEKVARAQQDSALALSISLLSAGVGEQFDWKNIWYFDTGIDGWTGNGVPTTVQGFLRPANRASDSYVISPSGIAVDTAKYQEIRLRIRKGGNPTFAGYVWWKAIGQSFDISRRVSIPAPSFDAQNIAVITLSVPWTDTASVDQIRLDLSSAQTSTDYFEIDWFAVGRPSPAASTAQILDEATARAAADLAESTKRETLSTFLFGANEPGDLNLNTITSGIVYDEKTARVNAVSAVVQDVQSLQAEVTTLNDPVTGTVTLLQGEVNEISQVVVDLESVSSSRELELRAQSKKLDETAETTLRNALTGDKNKVQASNEVALARQELQANIVEGLSAEASARLTLETKVNQNNADIVENYYTKSGTDSAIAQKATILRAYSNISSKTFAQATAPTNRGLDPETNAVIALQIGDIWINTSDSNKQSRWSGTAWVFTTDESSLSLFITSTYNPAIQDITDSKIESWFSTNDPSLAWSGTALSHTGDLWYNSATKLFKRWSGSAWVTIEDQTAINAAAAASVAQDTADGKITTFAQALQPTAEGIGDLWIDIDDSNKPYRWNGTTWIEIRDQAIAAVDARVTTVETAKIGYCIIGGRTSEHADKTACNAAGGVWNIGLPWATAVKQVSVTDPNGNSASVEDSFTAIKTVNDGLKASKVVKVDVNNRVSGYGLYAGETTSEFITSVDRFAVASPDSSVGLWVANTAYAVGNCKRLASNNSKMLVCKVAGTSGGSAPSISGSIGSLVIDGTITWQIASRVPFSVVSSTTQIGDVQVQPGVYIDGALIVNSTVNTQQIASQAVDTINIKDAAITNAKISGYIKSTDFDGVISDTGVISNNGTTGWAIGKAGDAVFDAADIRGKLTASQINSNGLSIYDTNGNVILNAGTSAFSGNVTGTVNGTEASTVVSNAANGQSAYNDLPTKLSKAGDTITGRINLAVADGIFAGTDLNNGVYLGNQGIVGKKAGATTFAVDTAGNATFAGTLAANTVTSSSIQTNAITTEKILVGSVSVVNESGWTSNGYTVPAGISASFFDSITLSFPATANSYQIFTFNSILGCRFYNSGTLPKKLIVVVVPYVDGISYTPGFDYSLVVPLGGVGNNFDTSISRSIRLSGLSAGNHSVYFRLFFNFYADDGITAQIPPSNTVVKMINNIVWLENKV